MAYEKQTWSSNELITADKLNHIEDGIPTKTSQLTNDSGFLTSHQSIAGKKNTQSAVNSPSASGTAVAFIDSISQDAQGVITPTKKTVASASQSAAGLMSADDKKKLDGIAEGAQVNSITGVKGNAESSYRTGDINLTPANIGLIATVSLSNCSSIAEIHQALIDSNSLEGRAEVGKNTTNNFKTLVGDPNTGSNSASAFVTIEAQTDDYAVMHCIVTGNNGTKHKYIFSSVNYPSNNKQTEWENVNLTLQNLGAINGTWTPVDTSLTLSENTGRYYKIGNLVYLWAKFKVSQAIGNGGIITLSGIPSAAQPTLDTQTVGTAANIAQGKPLYCRAYAATSTSIGVISIANNTGAALDADSVYIANVIFYRD